MDCWWQITCNCSFVIVFFTWKKNEWKNLRWKWNRRKMFFVCFEFFVQLEYFLLIWRRHHCRWRAANFDLCSAFIAIEQWGFFNVPHILWHGASVYNCHLREPVTLTSNAERLTVELLLPVLTTYVGRGWEKCWNCKKCLVMY